MDPRSNHHPQGLFLDDDHADFGTSGFTLSPRSGVSRLSTSFNVPQSITSSMTSLPPSSEINVNTLPLQVLMSNAEVFDLFRQNADLHTTQSKLHATLYGLTKENAALTVKLMEMQTKIEVMESARLPAGQISPPLSVVLSCGDSVSPSDSISQRGEDTEFKAPTVISSPPERPSNFSSKVLWTLKECHRDPDAYKGNRICLSAAIRNQDGDPIDDLEGIKNTARIHFLSTLLSLPIPLNTPTHQTGLWWKSFKPKEWRDAIRYLEGAHPVVAYCAHHWKAEEIFRVVIQIRLDSMRAKKDARRYQDAAPSTMDVDMATKPPKRPHSAVSSAAGGSTPLEKKTIVTKPLKKRKRGRELLDGVFRSPTGELPSSESLLAMPPPTSTTVSSSMAPPATLINTSNVVVPITVHALGDILSNEFPLVKDSIPLFDAFKNSPNFSVGNPSGALEKWIEDINAADPNDPTLDEDNNYQQWGHQQLSLSSPILTSWAAVGTVDIACRLISVLVKTCRVAREICRINGKTTTSFLADSYLDRIIETLWKLWSAHQAEVGKNPQNASQSLPPTPPALALPVSAPLVPTLVSPPAVSAHVSMPAVSAPVSTPAISAPVSTPAVSALVSAPLASAPLASAPLISAPTSQGLSQKSVQSLKIDELRELIRVQDIPVLAAKPKKDDYVTAIVNAPGEKRPTDDQIQSIITKRTITVKRSARSSQKT